VAQRFSAAIKPSFDDVIPSAPQAGEEPAVRLRKARSM
jgi:hypothetical protein